MSTVNESFILKSWVFLLMELVGIMWEIYVSFPAFKVRRNDKIRLVQLIKFNLSSLHSRNTFSPTAYRSSKDHLFQAFTRKFYMDFRYLRVSYMSFPFHIHWLYYHNNIYLLNGLFPGDGPIKILYFYLIILIRSTFLSPSQVCNIITLYY